MSNKKPGTKVTTGLYPLSVYGIPVKLSKKLSERSDVRVIYAHINSELHYYNAEFRIAITKIIKDFKAGLLKLNIDVKEISLDQTSYISKKDLGRLVGLLASGDAHRLSKEDWEIINDCMED